MGNVVEFLQVRAEGIYSLSQWFVELKNEGRAQAPTPECFKA
jgi:hypothetical protein